MPFLKKRLIFFQSVSIPHGLLTVSEGDVLGVHFNGLTNPHLDVQPYSGAPANIPDYVNGVPKHKFR